MIIINFILTQMCSLLQYILELSKVRAEIEGLRTSYKKDITVADERRRIEMDDARSRIQSLDSYIKNSLHTLKNAIQEALGRTENKISDGLKEERMVWRQNMVMLSLLKN